jgi:hypothetical protein
MSASALLVRSERLYLAIDHRLPRLHLSERGARFVEMDALPIAFWLWAAAAVFLLCLVGTLLWVREPEVMLGNVETQKPAVLSEV